MMKMMALTLLAASLSAPAIAGITETRQSAAIRSLESVARLAPGDGGAMIELASAYRLAGRGADADNAYRQALALDNVMLETKTGDAIWSHQVARRALAQTVALSAR